MQISRDQLQQLIQLSVQHPPAQKQAMLQPLVSALRVQAGCLVVPDAAFTQEGLRSCLVDAAAGVAAEEAPLPLADATEALLVEQSAPMEAMQLRHALEMLLTVGEGTQISAVVHMLLQL